MHIKMPPSPLRPIYYITASNFAQKCFVDLQNGHFFCPFSQNPVLFCNIMSRK